METDKLRNKKADRTTMAFTGVVIAKQKMKKIAQIVIYKKEDGHSEFQVQLVDNSM